MVIYKDLEKIYRTSEIENKYALAMIVATRARQISEQKGRQLDGEGSERYITHAIEEIEDDRLIIHSIIAKETPKGDDTEVGGR
ncbi:MAG: DNA-directed RNA polymerase subunit omega [Synergistaceae bacterium]|jgi:DNA-directed RNA polymerase subunit omega|nr:DNA-directed RNA polymerase subunit omega [Synergistaceae bacterium]